MSASSDLRKVRPVKWLTVTAMLMALNIAMSSFSIPVPGGHLYLNDAVICTAAILLDPLGAFIVGGVGAFLGDFFFYPAPMFVSLLTHGLQAAVVSLCAAAGALWWASSWAWSSMWWATPSAVPLCTLPRRPPC